MDMNNDELIRKFLQENVTQPDDNGFSERVMRHIPRYTPVWIALLKAVLLVAAALLVFFYFDLWTIICNKIVELIQWIAYAKHTSLSPLLLLIPAGLLAYGADRLKVFR